jgi:hypothetical protein
MGNEAVKEFISCWLRSLCKPSGLFSLRDRDSYYKTKSQGDLCILLSSTVRPKAPQNTKTFYRQVILEVGMMAERVLGLSSLRSLCLRTFALNLLPFILVFPHS